MYEKQPGEAPKVFLPQVSERETKQPEPEDVGKTVPVAPSQPAAKPELKTREIPQESVKAVRAALRGAMEEAKAAEAEARMTVRDFISVLDMKGLIVLDWRTGKYFCWVCGAPFENAAQIKGHFGGIGVPKEDMEALVADAKRARSRAALEARVDRFLGESDNEEEVLMVGKCAKGCFYRAVLALCKGQTVKIVPFKWEWKRAWNVAALVKQILGNGVSETKADDGVRLSLSLLPRSQLRTPSSQK